MTELSGLLSSSSETKKHLLVCFMQNPCYSRHMAYFLQSVSVDSLVPKSSPSEAGFTLHRRWVTEHPCSFMGCINVGERLYLFGGQKPEKDDPSWNFDCNDLSTEVHCYYLPELVSFPLSLDGSLSEPCIPKSPPAQMKSGKCDPAVAEVGGYIYVLGDTIIVDDENDGYPTRRPSFEVYDPWENKWSDLPIPQHSHFVDLFHEVEWFDGWTRGFLNYVVVDKKICVSVANCSFAFDTGSGKWEACKLFDDFDPWEVVSCRPIGPLPRKKRLRRSTRLSSKKEVRQCGQRFGFDGRAVIYDEDILLGTLPPYVPLVAYLLVDGEVERMQCFWLNLPDDRHPDWASGPHIVDLGGGYFCFLYSTDSEGEEDKSFVTIVTFKISRVGGSIQQSPADEFLTCEVVGLKKDLESNWHLPCQPIRAFAM